MADENAPQITVTPIPDGPRRKKQASTQLLHNWLALAHPNAVTKYEMRLGPTPLSVAGFPVTPAIEAMLRVANRYADAVYIEPDEIGVVEAKVVGSPGAISQLTAYAGLVLATPSIREHLTKPLRQIHLWAVDDELSHSMALNAGQSVIVYTPDWIADYLNQVYWKR